MSENIECAQCPIQNKFDYSFINCRVNSLSQSSAQGTHQQIIIYRKGKPIGNDSPVAYQREIVNARYFIPLSEDSKIRLAYYNTSSNKYIYIYMLQQAAEKRQLIGDHFTMGMRPGQKFDFHQTTYIMRLRKPCYRFFNINESIHTVQDVKDMVCERKKDERKCKGTATSSADACNFFESLMDTIYSAEMCQLPRVNENTAPPEKYSVTSKYVPQDMRTGANVGGSKQKQRRASNRKLRGGGDPMEMFDGLNDKIVSVLGKISNTELREVQYHDIYKGFGTLTAFLETSDSSDNPVNSIPYVFPFYFGQTVEDCAFLHSMYELLTNLGLEPAKQSDVTPLRTSVDDMIKLAPLCIHTLDTFVTSVMEEPQLCKPNDTMCSVNQASPLAANSCKTSASRNTPSMPLVRAGGCNICKKNKNKGTPTKSKYVKFGKVEIIPLRM